MRILDNAALIVVDVNHNNGWRPEQVAASELRQSVQGSMERVLADWREKGQVVVHVIFAISPDYSGQEGQPSKNLIETKGGRRLGIFRRGKDDANKRQSLCLICDAPEILRVAEFIGHRCGSEPAFVKKARNAFSNAGLAGYLKSEGITTVYLMGCNTFQCIKSTAIGATKEGFDVALIWYAVYPKFASSNEMTLWFREVQSEADNSRRVWSV